jgi:long-subunit fatty acid transport protein
LDARLRQYLSVYGNGFNFGLGAIVKPVQNLRIGVAYQSPIWYNLAERFQENLDIDVSNDPKLYQEYNDPNYFDYQLKTPAKLTGSIAYVFGKLGLISIDYIYQDYTNTRLQPSSVFIDENQDLSTGLRSTSSIRAGTEWRVKIVSIRGGYRFVQSPYKNDDSSYDLNGYSLGLGFKITRHVNLDFAYDTSSHQDQYSFLNIDGVQPAYIDVKNDRFTSSLVLNF